MQIGQLRLGRPEGAVSAKQGHGLKEGRGSHFDPSLLDLFLANLDDALRAKQQEEAAASARWQWLEDHRRAETLK